MTKDLINGIAITCFVVALSLYMPIIGFLFVLFVPLPTLFYRVKLGRKSCIAIPATVIVLLVVMAGGLTIDIFFLIELLILGFALGEFVELNASIENVILYTCGIVLMTTVFSLFFYSAIADYGILPLVSEYIGKNLEYTLTLYKDMGMPEETIHMIQDSKEQIQYVLVRLLPGLIVLSTLLITWINLLMAKTLFLWKGLHFPDFGQLNRWKTPDILVWGVICAGIFILIPYRTVKIFGINSLLILSVIYFFQGIAIVSFFFEKKQLPRMLKIILYSLIGIQQILLFFIIGIGFFDVWLDLRKIGGKSESNLKRNH